MDTVCIIVLMSSIRTLSRRVKLQAHLSIRISSVFSIRSCVSDTGQYSLRYSSTGLTTVRWAFPFSTLEHLWSTSTLF
ncbi:hypothetical protein Y032_0574g183 [Ancylostoma ceylanicum]|uniref:Uncharacterized protein n=1 Tax=Ancylostoma ceylanicum TaxID=53326 RepID=A0A016WQI5_9BILA|nr:hypothetical protein Y032_0574g183 [Ancylostoma ceylanicum]